jgi:hypothetical protein
MDYRKVTFDDGIEVELDPDVAAEIEAARAANEDQLQRVRTAIASMRLISDDMHGMHTGCLSVPQRTRTTP